MNKNTFRLIVVLSLLLAILGSIYDVFWADEITKKVIDYSIEVEPEWSDSEMYIFVGIGVLGALQLMSFIGLLVFWNPARHLYLASFVAIVLLTLFAGVNVSNAVATMIYDTSTLLSGVILGLLYWSPVKKFFTDKSN